MQDNFPDWQSHEKDTARLLDADQTVTSGNKFYDIADVVTRGHVFDDNLQFMADSKSTLRNSYRLEKVFLRSFREKAILRGKIFVLPLRFEDKYTHRIDDWVVISAADFSEIVGLDARKDAKAKSEQVERRARDIINKTESIASKIETLLLDKSIANKSRKSLLDLLDIIDKLTLSVLGE